MYKKSVDQVKAMGIQVDIAEGQEYGIQKLSLIHI